MRSRRSKYKVPATRWLRIALLSACVCAAQHGEAARALDLATADDEAADDLAGDVAAGDAPQRWAIHGQFTYLEQEDSNFHAPYGGPNSLAPGHGKETTDLDLWAGAALWPGAEAWINPQLDQGFGLSNTLGLAGFPSGEAYKVGANAPYCRLQRIFVRDTIEGAGERTPVKPDALWLGGEQSANRWVVTLGKFAVTDLFDNNQYAHDPRADFMNWTAIDGGAFDYAADAWGFTLGAALERYQGPWAMRFGVFDLSTVPNSVHLDPGFHEFQILAEVEHRHAIADHGGKVMLTVFDTRGRMGLLDQAVALAESTGTSVSSAAVRQYRGRLGGVLNLEQEVTESLGLFARYSKAAGNVETYEFTDVDRSLEAGASLKGTAWRRRDDTFGLTLIDNGISAEREQYLNAGGLGILIGDGRLPHPGPEEILESYYSAAVIAHLALSFDYQFVEHPAYNRDRGPVSVFAVRVHAQF
jgi:high affinity Mn2+ porin